MPLCRLVHMSTHMVCAHVYTRVRARYLYEYADASIAADRRASYNSSKHRWIEMAGMYTM